MDEQTPFSWSQTVVLHEGRASDYVLSGFDPGLQPVQFNMLPNSPVYMTIESFNGNYGLIQSVSPAKIIETQILDGTLPANSVSLTEEFPFQVAARGITNQDIYTLTYDLRTARSRVRGRPVLFRSPGDVIRPGQMVRYVWTQTSYTEKQPKVEAAFVGRTGPATGLQNSVITQVLALKVQPMVLGHYLLTVTPRDVRGEPPRGSTSNGQVFLCAFGSQDLPPATDGFVADSFTPAVGQTITVQPVAVDPQTGRTVFDRQVYDFGDGTITTNGNAGGAATHAYSQPGIYRIRCTVTGDSGLTAAAEDNIIVGATPVPQTPLLPFKYFKNIVPDEAGTGNPGQDTFSMSFRGLTAPAKGGDRIVFCFNRNRFGRLNASDGDDTDIVLGAGGTFTGATLLASRAGSVTVIAGASSLGMSVQSAQLDRTGDPRWGRADLSGIFKNQRLAVCIVPADGSARRVLLYTGNVTLKVRYGVYYQSGFVSEAQVFGTSTLREPNPRTQELPTSSNSWFPISGQ